VRPAVAAPASVVTGIVAAFGMSFFGGIAVEWSALFAVPVTVFVYLVLQSPIGVEPVWAPLPDPHGRATEHMAASLASRLAEAADSPGRYRTRLQPRLAALATAKLRRAGIDELYDPRAPAVLGDDLYRLVTDPDATMPDPRTATAMFARLEED
jgi:hypothetical protein